MGHNEHGRSTVSPEIDAVFSVAAVLLDRGGVVKSHAVRLYLWQDLSVREIAAA
jgi:hypothetical protein